MSIEQEKKDCIKLQSEGKTRSEIAKVLGLTKRQVKSRLERNNVNPAIEEAMDAFGSTQVPNRVWMKNDKFSALFVTPVDEGGADIIGQIDDICERVASRAKVVTKPLYRGGEHLLVISPADIHMGKLAEIMETGEAYNIAIAEGRTKEGVKGLLEMSVKF